MMKDPVTGKPLLDASDQKLIDGVLAHQPRALAKAITLVESTRRDHQARAEALLEAILPSTGRSIRLGISGSPGSGKSTFIEALGLYLIGQGHRVAVLAVDPSSSISGGSILGDKTRMERLSPGAQLLHPPLAVPRIARGRGGEDPRGDARLRGGRVRRDHGRDRGGGPVGDDRGRHVDVFVLIQLPNAGDDLQAIKKGIVELADIIVINKADLDPKAAALAKHQFAGRFPCCAARSPPWRPPVVTLSAAAGTGIDAFWAEIERFRQVMTASGELEAKRQRQAVHWMWTLIDSGLRSRFRTAPASQAQPGDDQPGRGRGRSDARRRRVPASGIPGQPQKRRLNRERHRRAAARTFLTSTRPCAPD